MMEIKLVLEVMWDRLVLLLLLLALPDSLDQPAKHAIPAQTLEMVLTLGIVSLKPIKQELSLVILYSKSLVP
jgi:hypothetical protein